MIAMQERWHLCMKCGSMKPRSDFGTRNGRGEPLAHCKVCRKDECRAYQAKKNAEANYIRCKSLEAHPHTYAIAVASAERGRPVSREEFLAIIRGEVKESEGRWSADYQRVGWRHRKTG